MPRVVNVVPTEPRVLAGFERLYRDFMAPGDLVFDVGANIGENTELFARLGARVVAIEPLEECAEEIPAGPGVTVERCAVGAGPGRLDLRVCSRHLDISSGSPEWIRAMRRTGAAPGPWDRRLTVPMTTLDALIGRHGRPRFVKVDVEGYELEVLRGLSLRVPALSLETHRALVGKTLACLGRLRELGFERFAVSEGHTARLSAWMDAPAASAAVREIEWGDLYAR
jgi:FkbM family methyltransferase